MNTIGIPVFVLLDLLDQTVYRILMNASCMTEVCAKMEALAQILMVRSNAIVLSDSQENIVK